MQELLRVTKLIKKTL